ncbi:polymorphic toxin type 44 domain-containing protein [Achromobacter mucicolens]|uniref:PAAR domain-containing protein n=1 Tax=Achromobacter mucicolens TaxID=1389922 RepID=UPI0024498D86|nr:PAAR domain-containing protein [Achromobacter mucicolens]MDH0093730.1 polymorphic toxin type 44 domain-containing protein [Achromobacter mucicolens]
MMTDRPIVRVGDKTTHGGTVTEGFSSYHVLGRAAAGMGHRVTCPRCEGVFPIAEGVATFAVGNSFVAVDGMKTTCGASLIASQTSAVVGVGPGSVVRASSGGGASGKRLLTDLDSPRQQGSSNVRQADCDHSDTAIPLAEFIIREMKTNPFSIRGRQIYDANHYDARTYLKDWEDAPWYTKLSGRKTYLEKMAEAKLWAYTSFAELIGPNRPWDHKPALQNLLGPNLNKGWQKFGDFDYYYDIWSNIHYGYVGVALGFSKAELINSAGLAQALLDSYKALADMRWPTMQNHPENGSWPASADDHQDYLSIKLGCDLHAYARPHELTTTMLLHKIALVPMPWGIGQDKAKKPHKCDR